MEYCRVNALLGNKLNQLQKFSTKDRVEINDNARETYKTNSQIKFKTTMIKPINVNYCDA